MNYDIQARFELWGKVKIKQYAKIGDKGPAKKSSVQNIYKQLLEFKNQEPVEVVSKDPQRVDAFQSTKCKVR